MSYVLGGVGDEAKALQTAMKQHGFYSGAIDGILGPGSRAAAQKWAASTLKWLAGWAEKAKAAGNPLASAMASTASKAAPSTLSEVEALRVLLAGRIPAWAKDAPAWTQTASVKAFLQTRFNVTGAPAPMRLAPAVTGSEESPLVAVAGATAGIPKVVLVGAAAAAVGLFLLLK